MPSWVISRIYPSLLTIHLQLYFLALLKRFSFLIHISSPFYLTLTLSKFPMCRIVSSLGFSPLTLKVSVSLEMEPSSVGCPPPWGWNIVRSSIRLNSFWFSGDFQKSRTIAVDSNYFHTFQWLLMSYLVRIIEVFFVCWIRKLGSFNSSLSFFDSRLLWGTFHFIDSFNISLWR